MTKAALETIYKEISDITQPKCATECRCPQSCCSAEYCEIAIDWAKERYGIMLAHTQHPTLPLMGADGCTAAPHLRPLCTLHLCSIGSYGFDKDADFTKRYWKLRRQADKLESQNDAHKDH